MFYSKNISNLFTYFLSDVYLGCFTFFTITNNTAISIPLWVPPATPVRVFFKIYASMWNYCVIKYVSTWTFNLVTLQSSYINLQPHLKYSKIPISPHLPQYYFTGFFIFANLMVINLYHIVLISIFLITREIAYTFTLTDFLWFLFYKMYITPPPLFFANKVDSVMGFSFLTHVMKWFFIPLLFVKV